MCGDDELPTQNLQLTGMFVLCVPRSSHDDMALYTVLAARQRHVSITSTRKSWLSHTAYQHEHEGLRQQTNKI
jgi:hypothetical protein